MVSNQGTDRGARSGSRSQRDSIWSLLLRAASQLFGGTVVTTEPKVRNENGGAAAASAAEAAKNLERTLEHFESMLKALEEQMQAQAPAAAQGSPAAQAEPEAPAVAEPAVSEPAVDELAELKLTIRDTFERLEDTLQHLATQAERLADGASDLAKVAGGVEGRMVEVTRIMRQTLKVEAARGQAPEAPIPEAVAPEPEAVVEPPVAEPEPEVLEPEAPLPPPEPVFAPGGAPLDLALAAVGGFQTLMDAQRALDALEETDGASVTSYRNGDATLEVTLKAAVTARRFVDTLRGATGQTVIIEESRPERDKLRLRFVGTADS